jgi:hypothetical protein
MFHQTYGFSQTYNLQAGMHRRRHCRPGLDSKRRGQNHLMAMANLGQQPEQLPENAGYCRDEPRGGRLSDMLLRARQPCRAAQRRPGGRITSFRPRRKPFRLATAYSNTPAEYEWTVIQSSGPLRLAIVDRMNVHDGRVSNYPRRYNGAPSKPTQPPQDRGNLP